MTQSSKRNSDDTKKAIIQAARIIFTRHGYDAASTRDIAAKAGVNIALINRYFGSKEGLFDQAVMPAFAPDGSPMIGDPKDLPEVFVAMMLKKSDKDEFDPLRAALKSASSDVVGKKLRKALDANLIEPFAEWMGKDGRQKAVAMWSTVLGYEMLNGVLGMSTGTKKRKDELEALLHASFKAVVDAG